MKISAINNRVCNKTVVNEKNVKRNNTLTLSSVSNPSFKSSGKGALAGATVGSLAGMFATCVPLLAGAVVIPVLLGGAIVFSTGAGGAAIGNKIENKIDEYKNKK